MTLFDGPWYRFPARVICAVRGHAPSRRAVKVKVYGQWFPVPDSQIVMICDRCHTVDGPVPVIRWVERATVTPDA